MEKSDGTKIEHLNIEVHLISIKSLVTTAALRYSLFYTTVFQCIAFLSFYAREDYLKN